MNVIPSSNELRNMAILLGKGSTEAKFGPIGWIRGNVADRCTCIGIVYLLNKGDSRPRHLQGKGACTELVGLVGFLSLAYIERLNSNTQS